MSTRTLGSSTQPYTTVLQRHRFTYSSAIVLCDKSLETNYKFVRSSVSFRSRAEKTSSRHFGNLARRLIQDPAMAFGEEQTALPQETPLNPPVHRGTVCVTGAAGFIGSWLIMRLLERGYSVRATVRDTGNPVKTKHLLDLPGANERLTLWKADLDDEGSFDAAIDGCEGVFHVATPMDFESEDPENEIIKPTINGVLNVMRSCAKAKSVKRVVFTSSAGTVNFTDDFQTPGKVFDESCWTNVDLCRKVKMTGWMYFVSKTLAEKAAWDFAEENKIDLITVIPTLVVGPFIMQTMPPSMITALALLTRNEPHYMILRQVQLVHLDDLCMSHIFVYEHPEAKGRYISSTCDATIVQVAKMLAQKYPEYNVPTTFKDADESLPAVPFSSKKLLDLGFKFNYTMEDVSVALPVSSMKPFVKVGGSASSSPPSSPSQYHRQNPHFHDHSGKNPSGHHHHHHQYVHSSNLVQHGETPGLEFPARGQAEVVSSHHQYVHNLSVSAHESLILDVDGGQREPGIEFPVKRRALELDSQHHQYLPNSNLSWHEPQGFELHPNSQGVELHPKVHSEQSGHQQSHHQQFVPYAHESYGKIPMVSVVELPSKRQSEVSRGEFPSMEKSELSNFHQQYVPHRHESYREIPTVSGVEFSSKGQSEVNKRDFPSKGHSEFGGFHQQSLSNRCEPYQEIPRMSGSEFSSKGLSEVGRGELPLKGQAEFGNVRYQYVSQGHESYLQVPMVSRAEFTSKVQSEIGRFEFPLKGRPEVSSLHQQQMPRQRDSYLEISPLSRVEFPDQEQQVDVSSHHSHVISNITPPLHESYHEIPVVPGFEFPLKGQSDIGSEIHPEILINRQYKEKVVDPFMTHVEARGNLQQFEQQHVNVQSGIVVGEVGNDNRRISNLSSHQFDMNSPVCLQPQQKPLVYHQAAGHSSSGVHHDQEHIYKDHHHELDSSNSRQKNTFLHPLGRQGEQLQHLQIDDELHQVLYNDHEHNSLYYATSPRYSHDFVSASQSGTVLEHMDSMPGARDINPSSSQERYLENHHHHVQVPWVYDEYGNRVDYISSQLRGNLTPLNFHPNYTSYTPVDEHIMYHQQSPFTEEDARFQGQNLNHLPKRFEDRHYAGIQSKENLADAWILNSYQEQLPSYSEQYRSDQVNFWKHNESGEYYPSVSRELSIENLNAGMDHRMYAAEQTEQLASFRDDREKTRGLVLHQVNHQVEKARMLADGEVNGVHVVGDSMQSDLGQNNIWDRYPRCYPGVHPGSIFHVTPPVDKGFSTELAAGNANFAAMYGGERLLQDVKALNLGNAPQRKLEHMRIETHSGNNSVVHLQSSDGQRLGFHRDAEGEDVNAVLGQRDGHNIERREHVYPYNKTNDAAEANIPNYWSNDALQKNTNAFYQDNQHVKDFDFTRETEDIKFPATESFKRNTGFLRGTDISCEPNAFTLLEDNEILSSGDFLHAITSSVALVPDKPTDAATSDNFTFVSVSSPQRINVVTSTTVPIYDQTPPNSVDAVVRETLWAEPEEGSKHNELENNSITGSDRVMPITEELSVECNSNGLELPRQDEGVDKTCLNGKMGEDINRTSRNMDLSLYGPNILSSSMNSRYEILDKKDSSGKAKEEVKQVVYKNDHVGTVVPISDLEENVAQQEVPENNLLGLEEDVHNHSVDMAKSASTEAKVQALDKGLQTIKNADLEEIRELGSGTYGTVYHGKWKGSDVAIKRIKASCFEGRPSERERLIADFWKEASILSQLHHPNVVSFYGVVQDGPNDTLATVTEFMVNGSLKQVLRKKDRTIDRRKRLILAMDAAFGMEYLHEKGVVHFDLKCENLLVNMRDPHRPVCKIGDMGLSKVKHQTLVSGGVRGTLPWMAPELLSGKSGMVTDKIDVYSFGIVMWELLTGDEPYADMHCGSIIGGIMNNTLRPSVPSWCDPAWRSLMERCWSSDPEERPPFSEISKELRAVAASINLK